MGSHIATEDEDEIELSFQELLQSSPHICITVGVLSGCLIFAVLISMYTPTDCSGNPAVCANKRKLLLLEKASQTGTSNHSSPRNAVRLGNLRCTSYTPPDGQHKLTLDIGDDGKQNFSVKRSSVKNKSHGKSESQCASNFHSGCRRSYQRRLAPRVASKRNLTGLPMKNSIEVLNPSHKYTSGRRPPLVQDRDFADAVQLTRGNHQMYQPQGIPRKRKQNNNFKYDDTNLTVTDPALTTSQRLRTSNRLCRDRLFLLSQCGCVFSSECNTAQCLSCLRSNDPLSSVCKTARSPGCPPSYDPINCPDYNRDDATKRKYLGHKNGHDRKETNRRHSRRNKITGCPCHNKLLIRSGVSTLAENYGLFSERNADGRSWGNSAECGSRTPPPSYKIYQNLSSVILRSNTSTHITYSEGSSEELSQSRSVGDLSVDEVSFMSRVVKHKSLSESSVLISSRFVQKEILLPGHKLTKPGIYHSVSSSILKSVGDYKKGNRKSLRDLRKENRTFLCDPSKESRKTLCDPSKESRKSLCDPSKESRKSLCDPSIESRKSLCGPSIESRKSLCGPSIENRESLCDPSKESRKSLCDPSKEGRNSLCDPSKEGRKSLCDPSKEGRKSLCDQSKENRKSICDYSKVSRKSLCDPKKENRKPYCDPRKENRKSSCDHNKKFPKSLCDSKKDNRKSFGYHKKDDRKSLCDPKKEYRKSLYDHSKGTRKSLYDRSKESRKSLCDQNKESKGHNSRRPRKCNCVGSITSADFYWETASFSCSQQFGNSGNALLCYSPEGTEENTWSSAAGIWRRSHEATSRQRITYRQRSAAPESHQNVPTFTLRATGGVNTNKRTIQEQGRRNEHRQIQESLMINQSMHTNTNNTRLVRLDNCSSELRSLMKATILDLQKYRGSGLTGCSEVLFSGELPLGNRDGTEHCFLRNQFRSRCLEIPRGEDHSKWNPLDIHFCPAHSCNSNGRRSYQIINDNGKPQLSDEERSLVVGVQTLFSRTHSGGRRVVSQKENDYSVLYPADISGCKDRSCTSKFSSRSHKLSKDNNIKIDNLRGGESAVTYSRYNTQTSGKLVDTSKNKSEGSRKPIKDTTTRRSGPSQRDKQSDKIGLQTDNVFKKGSLKKSILKDYENPHNCCRNYCPNVDNEGLESGIYYNHDTTKSESKFPQVINSSQRKAPFQHGGQCTNSKTTRRETVTKLKAQELRKLLSMSYKVPAKALGKMLKCETKTITPYFTKYMGDPTLNKKKLNNRLAKSKNKLQHVNISSHENTAYDREQTGGHMNIREMPEKCQPRFNFVGASERAPISHHGGGQRLKDRPEKLRKQAHLGHGSIQSILCGYKCVDDDVSSSELIPNLMDVSLLSNNSASEANRHSVSHMSISIQGHDSDTAYTQKGDSEYVETTTEGNAVNYSGPITYSLETVQDFTNSKLEDESDETKSNRQDTYTIKILKNNSTLSFEDNASEKTYSFSSNECSNKNIYGETYSQQHKHLKWDIHDQNVSHKNKVQCRSDDMSHKMSQRKGRTDNLCKKKRLQKTRTDFGYKQNNKRKCGDTGGFALINKGEIPATKTYQSESVPRMKHQTMGTYDIFANKKHHVHKDQVHLDSKKSDMHPTGNKKTCELVFHRSGVQTPSKSNAASNSPFLHLINRTVYGEPISSSSQSGLSSESLYLAQVITNSSSLDVSGNTYRREDGVVIKADSISRHGYHQLSPSTSFEPESSRIKIHTSYPSEYACQGSRYSSKEKRSVKTSPSARQFDDTPEILNVGASQFYSPPQGVYSKAVSTWPYSNTLSNKDSVTGMDECESSIYSGLSSGHSLVEEKTPQSVEAAVLGCRTLKPESRIGMTLSRKQKQRCWTEQQSDTCSLQQCYTKRQLTHIINSKRGCKTVPSPDCSYLERSSRSQQTHEDSNEIEQQSDTCSLQQCYTKRQLTNFINSKRGCKTVPSPDCSYLERSSRSQQTHERVNSELSPGTVHGEDSFSLETVQEVDSSTYKTAQAADSSSPEIGQAVDSSTLETGQAADISSLETVHDSDRLSPGTVQTLAGANPKHGFRTVGVQDLSSSGDRSGKLQESHSCNRQPKYRSMRAPDSPSHKCRPGRMQALASFSHWRNSGTVHALGSSSHKHKSGIVPALASFGHRYKSVTMPALATSSHKRDSKTIPKLVNSSHKHNPGTVRGRATSSHKHSAGTITTLATSSHKHKAGKLQALAGSSPIHNYWPSRTAHGFVSPPWKPHTKTLQRQSPRRRKLPASRLCPPSIPLDGERVSYMQITSKNGAFKGFRLSELDQRQFPSILKKSHSKCKPIKCVSSDNLLTFEKQPVSASFSHLDCIQPSFGSKLSSSGASAICSPITEQPRSRLEGGDNCKQDVRAQLVHSGEMSNLELRTEIYGDLGGCPNSQAYNHIHKKSPVTQSSVSDLDAQSDRFNTSTQQVEFAETSKYRKQKTENKFILESSTNVELGCKISTSGERVEHSEKPQRRLSNKKKSKLPLICSKKTTVDNDRQSKTDGEKTRQHVLKSWENPQNVSFLSKTSPEMTRKKRRRTYPLSGSCNTVEIERSAVNNGRHKSEDVLVKDLRHETYNICGPHLHSSHKYNHESQHTNQDVTAFTNSQHTQSSINSQKLRTPKYSQNRKSKSEIYNGEANTVTCNQIDVHHKTEKHKSKSDSIKDLPVSRCCELEAVDKGIYTGKENQVSRHQKLEGYTDELGTVTELGNCKNRHTEAFINKTFPSESSQFKIYCKANAYKSELYKTENSQNRKRLMPQARTWKKGNTQNVHLGINHQPVAVSDQSFPDENTPISIYRKAKVHSGEWFGHINTKNSEFRTPEANKGESVLKKRKHEKFNGRQSIPENTVIALERNQGVYGGESCTVKTTAAQNRWSDAYNEGKYIRENTQFSIKRKLENNTCELPTTRNMQVKNAHLRYPRRYMTDKISVPIANFENDCGLDPLATVGSVGESEENKRLICTLSPKVQNGPYFSSVKKDIAKKAEGSRNLQHETEFDNTKGTKNHKGLTETLHFSSILQMPAKSNPCKFKEILQSKRSKKSVQHFDKSRRSDTGQESGVDKMLDVEPASHPLCKISGADLHQRVRSNQPQEVQKGKQSETQKISSRNKRQDPGKCKSVSQKINSGFYPAGNMLYTCPTPGPQKAALNRDISKPKVRYAVNTISPTERSQSVSHGLLCSQLRDDKSNITQDAYVKKRLSQKSLQKNSSPEDSEETARQGGIRCPVKNRFPNLPRSSQVSPPEVNTHLIIKAPIPTQEVTPSDMTHTLSGLSVSYRFRESDKPIRIRKLLKTAPTASYTDTKTPLNKLMGTTPLVDFKKNSGSAIPQLRKTMGRVSSNLDHWMPQKDTPPTECGWSQEGILKRFCPKISNTAPGPRYQQHKCTNRNVPEKDKASVAPDPTARQPYKHAFVKHVQFGRVKRDANSPTNIRRTDQYENGSQKLETELTNRLQKVTNSVQNLNEFQPKPVDTLSDPMRDSEITELNETVPRSASLSVEKKRWQDMHAGDDIIRDGKCEWNTHRLGRRLDSSELTNQQKEVTVRNTHSKAVKRSRSDILDKEICEEDIRSPTDHLDFLNLTYDTTPRTNSFQKLESGSKFKKSNLSPDTLQEMALNNSAKCVHLTTKHWNVNNEFSSEESSMFSNTASDISASTIFDGNSPVIDKHRGTLR